MLKMIMPVTFGNHKSFDDNVNDDDDPDDYNVEDDDYDENKDDDDYEDKNIYSDVKSLKNKIKSDETFSEGKLSRIAIILLIV